MTHKTLIHDARPNCAVKQILMPVTFSHRFFPDEEHDAGLLCHTLFGRMLHSGELISLCGGEPGTTEITVGVAKSELYMEYHHIATGCIGACLICRSTDSRLVLVNEHTYFA